VQTDASNALWIVGLFESISPVSGIDVLVSGIRKHYNGIDSSGLQTKPLCFLLLFLRVLMYIDKIHINM